MTTTTRTITKEDLEQYLPYRLKYQPEKDREGNIQEAYRTHLDPESKSGTPVAINIEKQSPDEVVFDMTRGYGADVVLECAGASASVDTCFRLVRKRGTFGAIGVFPEAVTINYGAVVSKELRMVGSYGHEWTGMELANRLLSEGKLNGDILISHKLPLPEWREGFEIMERGEGVRLLLHPVD